MDWSQWGTERSLNYAFVSLPRVCQWLNACQLECEDGYIIQHDTYIRTGVREAAGRRQEEVESRQGQKAASWRNRPGWDRPGILRCYVKAVSHFYIGEQAGILKGK